VTLATFPRVRAERKVAASRAVVAVVTTCFNEAQYIPQTINSVVRQETTAQVFHVVVDDGSTDSSLRVLREFEERYDHLRVLSVTNRGVAAAMNAGLIALPASVEFVVTLAGDDWIEDNFVQECLLALSRDPGADMVVPGMRCVVEDDAGDYTVRGSLVTEMPKVRHPSIRQLWEWEDTYAYGVAMFRREVLVEAGGFNPAAGGDCDWDMWIDLGDRGCRFAYAPNTHFYYVSRPGSGTRTKTQAIWDQHRLHMRRHHKRLTLPGQEFC